MADPGRAQQSHATALRLPNRDLLLADWIKMCIVEAKEPPCFSKNPVDFSRFFIILDAFKAENVMEPSVNLNDQFNDLLRLESLDKIIDNDIFFYAAFFNHVSTNHDTYMIDCKSKLIEKVVERLKCSQLVHILNNDILPFIIHTRPTGIIVNHVWEKTYVDAFLGICEQWLYICKTEGKALSQERYIYVAFACVTMGIKIALCQGKVSIKKTSKWWTNLLVEPSKHIDMKEEALKDLSEGLKFMTDCEVPPEYMVTLEHLQAMVSTGPHVRVRSLIVAREFLETITSYCQLEHWGPDGFRARFLRPLRMTYKDRHVMGITTSRGGIADLTIQGTSVVSIIETGLQFILTVCRLLDGRNYGSSNDYDDECTKWIKLLLDLVVYNDATAPQCIKLFTDPQSKVFQYFGTNFIIPRLNSDLQNYLKKSVVDVNWFMEIYDSASDIWQRQVFDLFIANKLPENSRLSDRGWKRFIQRFEKSYEGEALHQQQLLLPLLKSFASQYQSCKRSFDMIVHLLQLDTPCLFMRIPSAGSDPSPQLFREFLSQFIRSSNLRKQFLDEYEVLLENTSSSPNQFQVLIVTVMLEEIFKHHQRVRLTSQISSSALHVLTEADSNRCLDMKSARVRLASGLLYHLSSYIHPSSTDLKWLSDNCPDVCRLAQIYKLVAKIESFKFVASVEDESRLQQFITSYPRDVLRFFEFILKVKKALRAWNSRLVHKQVTFQNIGDLLLLVQNISDLADYLTLANISISDVRLESIKDQYKNVADSLESVLVCRIPDLSAESWCCLSKLLENHDVGFDEVIRDEIDKLVDMSAVCPQRTSIIKPVALVCDLQQLLQSIEKFIEPLQPCLDFLIFFELQQSNLFKRYLSNFLSSLLLCGSQGPSLLPVVTKEHLNEATNLTVDLIWKLCDGSATVQEVTLCDSLQLEDIDIEKERNNLSHFARIFSNRVSPKRSSSCEGLKGVTAVLDLLKNYEDVFTIREVCKQFKLTKCHEDPDLVCLVEVAEELQSKDRRAQLTMDDTVSKMDLFSEKLLLKDQHSRTIFQLFKEVKDCKALFEFAEEKGFTGEAGRQKFVTSHKLVTTQLQHEEYNAVVLNHLLGCFDYINPFLSRPSSFSELMQLVTSLPNIENGIRQLRTVNQNIGLIKMWFEGEGSENTARQLKTIIKSRVIFLRAVDSSDPVKLTLECDPDSKTTPDQPWSCEKLKEFAAQVKFMKYEMPKLQKDQKLDSNDIDGFLHVFNKAQQLQSLLQDLRILQIRNEIILNCKISCLRADISIIDTLVDKAKRDLSTWLESTKEHRDHDCQWLVFFSNRKLLQLHHYLVKEPLEHAEYIVREISVIFPNDLPTRTSQAKFVKKAIEDLCGKLQSLPPIKSAVVFLNKLMEYNVLHAPQQVMLVRQSTCSGKDVTVHGPVRIRHFTLHYVPGFTHKQQMQLLFDILQGIPLPFQLLRCTTSTTNEELELFFQRMTKFPEHQYVVFNTNVLSSDIQEVLVRRCLELLDSAAAAGSDTVTLPMLHFTETGHSVLRQMPWIIVNEHKDHESLLTTEHVRQWFKSSRDRVNFKTIELVYGNAGDGKTHYIRKELAKDWHDHTMALSINECFDPVEVIKLLRGMPLEQRYFALFLNFTLPKPAEARSMSSKQQQDANQEDIKQFWRLAAEIHWFFFYLLVIGYIEDHSSGLSFRLPGGLQWSVFIEVPAWCGDNAEQSLTQFNNDFPTFHYIGREVHISPQIPFDTDGDIDMQLVCKYLRAKETGQLDQWCHRGNRNPMPFKIGRIIKDLKSDECQKILETCLPWNITSRPKVIQRLYLKYLERRCKILEACPALMYNEGVGEPIEVWEKEEKKVKLTNIKHLRSLLFKTMENEVAIFCDQSLDTERNHQQLIYDGTAASFRFLSLKPDNISREERKQFAECGIKIQPFKNCHNRDFLDSCLSHALKIPLTNSRISLIDEKQYVMTLDYLVKMLNIHERRKCGIPVIINGETGVGKTFLLEMLSILWNQSMLSALDQERSSLMDILISKLQHMSELGKDGMESLLLNSPEEWFGLITCPVDKKVTTADMTEVNSVLTALKAPDSTSGKSISYDLLLHVLKLPDPHEPLSSLYRLFCSRLLKKRYDPLFSLVVFPETMQPYGSDIQSLFELASSSDHACSATARLLYGLFAGQPKKTFHKLCVHAALTIDNIKKFFEAVISEAKAILRWYNYGARQRSSVGQYGTVAAPPSLTIFLDEVNTASCPGFIKEIITDRTMDGKDIPENIFIVAACNPHRANSLAGQAEWFVGSYYVRPFHQTLQMLMWNYGSLSVAREKEYIDSKMSMTEPNLEPGKRTFFANLISKSQELVRGYAAERLQDNHPAEVVEVMSKSTVSQRDIQRVFTLYKWLQKYFTSLGKYQEDKAVQMLSIKLRALFVALAVVYYFRLNSTCREKFAKDMQQFRTHDDWKMSHIRFQTALTDELDWTINNMTVPPGIAKTEALKENVFATVVCTMARIPLIIVGQPGSSKTLSFKIVSMNLLGQGSPNAVFRNCEVFKTLDPHFYQCSRKSTSVEIETVFQQAIKRQASLNELSSDKLSVVMMDEAGLPERSHESLKVLHYYLDDQKVAFVGISNHILDAAKMNRAVSLFRPDLCQEDVEVLAKGCLLTYSEPMRDRDANYVRGFSHSYLEVMNDARIHVNTFFGLRDFIHFCAYLRRSQESLTPQLVISALERNFNGSKHFGLISRYFLERVFKIGRSTDKVKQQGVLEVLKMSLADHPKDLSAENEVRYKLIIDSSEDGSLVRLLFSFGVLKREVTRVHMSSNFPADSDSEKLGVVAAIKHSASQGHTVVLNQTDTVHECFYDLFNQRFMCIEDSTHGKRFYANVAIGSYIKPCPVHPHFQCVVIIKDSDLPHTPAAFLNRFEKYSLSHQLLLSDLLKYLPPILRGLVNTVRDKVSQFLSCCGESCLYGQNPVTLDSLLLTILPFHLPATHADSQSCSRRVKTKHAKLLAYLEWAMQHHLGFRFSPSSAAELLADGAHIEQLVLDNKTTHAGQLKDLAEVDIPEVVDEAMTFLKQDGVELDMTANTEIVTVLVQQWLITYLCKRLLQLMTPEALVTNHKKLPNHYISHYLNQQSHFSLKGVIVSYHSNLVQEWSANVKSGTSLVPNKLLCYCRSSDRLHNMPHEANTAAGPFLQEFIFPDTEKLQIFKITSLTTQEKLSLQIKGFNKKTYEEVLVLVANVEDVSLNTINHIRIMIEEFEVTQPASVPKLFVLLLHFPPRLFFNHFYSSYYLHGWDHYYLDTVGAGSTSTSINIQKWFSQCCAEPDTMVAPGSFMEANYLNSLLSEALPLVAPHISLKGCSDSELAASRSLGSKINHLNELLFTRGLDKVVFTHFTSYWTPSVMIAISEQAANLARLLESTLSITDAVNTIVKSYFYEFLLYILSLLNDCQSIMIVINSDVESPVEDLALSVMSNYPIPRNLSELKMQSIRIGKRGATKDGTQPKFSFPFFRFVYKLIEEQLNQCRRELAEQIAFVSSEDQGSIDSLDVLGTTQATQNEIYRTMVDHLVRLFSREDEPSAEGSRRQERQCLDAVFAAMDSRGVWNRYVKDFCATKLSLGSELFAKSMENTLTASTESSILRRVADLHVRVRLYHLDSESLSLMRVLDELQKRYQAIPEEQCNVDLFERPQKLFAVVIEATYSVLLIITDSRQPCVNELKRLSSSYLQLMRLPTIGGDATIRTNISVKTKWDIIHTAMLMLNTEEVFDEKFAQQVLEFFLYLHMKYCDKTSPVPAPCLSSLMDYTSKHSFACPDESKQQLLEGLLEHFFPSNGAYEERDVTWFLQQLIASSSVTVFSRQPATIRCLKLYLTRILTATNCPSVESSDSINPLHLYDDKTREGVATILLESPTHDGPFVPDFYQQCDAVLVPDNPECLLADLYFSISLEFMRQKRLDISYLIGLIKNISQILANESTSPLDSIILAVENQVLIHILLETLACKLSLDNDEISRLLDFVDDINKILNDQETGGGSDGGGHGLMLTIHMLRRHRSVHMIHRHLVTRYDDLCRDYSCLDSLHSKMQQQIDKAGSRRKSLLNDQFPFKLINNRQCREGVVYLKIRTELNIINTVAERRRKDSITKFMETVTSCYTVGLRGDSQKYIFNMAILLCVYYEYYCKKKCSQVLASVLETELKHFLDKGFLNLLVGLVDSNHLQYHPEQTAVTGSQEAVDPLYSFFTQSFKDTSVKDPDSLAMQHTLVHLVAAIVGSPIEYTNLWYHMFSPEQLKGSHIPGFSSAAACGAGQDEVLYDMATKLSNDGFNLEHKQLLHTTRGQLNIYSRYFTLWANYSALCLSLFMDSTLADQLIEAGMFSPGLPLRHYCFTRATDAWQLLCRNMNITVEERVQLVNQTIEHYYMESRANTECLRGPYDTRERVNECETFIHEKCFAPAWCSVQQKHTEVYSALSTYYSKDLRVLDSYYPECATKETFLLQLLSSTRLHDPTGPLYVLYQFVLKRPLFNGGGKLLPDLVDFYLWLHEEMAYCVLPDYAQQLSIKVALSSVLNTYSPTMRDQRHRQFNHVKKLYNSYEGRVGGRLEDSTKLIELLSVADERLNRGNILYNTIISIVDDFNQFLTAAVGHYSLRRMWRYFSNYYDAIPLVEVTVDACCFGDCLSLEDFSNLMPFSSKCCNLKRSTSSIPCCDSSLFSGCVPQVYDLLQLQEDIARQFLAGKQLLQNPSKIHRDFHFKESTPMTSVSDTFFQCSVTDTSSLETLHSKFKDDLEPEDMKKVKYEFHSLSYYTLLEVIIGLTSALNQLQKVLLEYRDEEWTPLLDKTLAEFINSRTGSHSPKEVLKVIGISRFNHQTNADVSLRDSQYDCLKSLKMRHVFKTLELLTNWMREGMFDFCVLPFSLKTDMRVEDRDHLRSVEKEAEGKAVSVLGEIKYITERLIQCERDFTAAATGSVISEVKPILDVLQETCELNDKQMESVVMRHISSEVQVQHYVHLRLELRRLHEVIRTTVAKEDGSENDVTWSDWIVGEDSDSIRETATHGFDKWYENTTETDLARRAAAQSPEEEEREDKPDEQPAEEWTPPASIVKATTRRRSTAAAGDGLPCSLPASKSPEYRQELTDLGSQYVDIVEFLNSIGLTQAADIVANDGFTGEIITNNDEVLDDLGMDAIDRLRFRILFQRELLKQTVPVAVAFPVKRVVAFFKEKRLLAKYAAAVEENGIDGEMLLLADGEALKQLGVSAAGVLLIKGQFKKLVLETLGNQSS